MTPNDNEIPASKAQVTPPPQTAYVPTPASSDGVGELPAESHGSDASSPTPAQKFSKRRPSDLPLTTLLNRLEAKQISGRSLHAVDRQDIVEYLVSDGRPTAEIALFLDLSVRTVERDREKIREKNTLRRDAGLSDRLLGQVLAEADVNVQKLWRIAGGKNVDARVKVEALGRAADIRIKSVELIHNLGHLGGAPLSDGVLELPSEDELDAELGRLAKIGPADESDKADIAEIKSIKKRAKLANKAAKMNRKDPRRDSPDAA